MAVTTKGGSKSKSSTSKPLVTSGIKALNEIITQALHLMASDIHIERRENFVWVRYRIGNELRLGTKLPLHAMDNLSRATKSLAQLNDKEFDRPQEGSFRVTSHDKPTTINVSTMPILGGEKIVLHIEQDSAHALSLSEIGYWGDNLKLLQRELAKLRGMVVITSDSRNANALMTLSVLGMLNHPPLKLGTIGHPINYQLHRTTHLGLGISTAFLAELLALDRQDSDVIIINSLPDTSAIATALRLAQKRLVIVNLQVPSASSALQQLINIRSKSEHQLVNIHAIAGQAIVRRLCSHCRESFVPSAELKLRIEKMIQPFTLHKLHKLEIEVSKNNAVDSSARHLGSSSTSIQTMWQAKAGGCRHCNFSGFDGHILINEVLDVTHPRIQSCLNHNYRLSTLESAALDIGMVPQAVDGVIKCLQGLVSFQDLQAVV